MKLTLIAWALFALGVVALLATPWLNRAAVGASIGIDSAVMFGAALVVVIVRVCQEG